jgi:predicted HTH domain antitoxin
VPEDELPEEIRLLAAARLFELGRLSAGKAAELAGFERLALLSRLGERGVPAINLSEEEAEAEGEAARELSR